MGPRKDLCRQVKLLLLIATVLLGVTTAGAQLREGKYEWYVLYQNEGSFDTGWKPHPNIKLHFDSTDMWGLGFGFNPSDRLTADFEILWGSSWFEGTGPVDIGDASLGDISLTQGADYFMGRLNAAFNLLADRPLTPYVGGGIGWVNFSTTVPGAPPIYSCAGYYYWWCGYSYPQYSETKFSYNLGAGLRWDAPSGGFFVKLGYTWEWYSVSSFDTTPQRAGIYVNLGTKF